MIVRYNTLNRFEMPLFHVCNPGTRYVSGTLTGSIGILSDTSDEELELNFNATSTLSLRAYRRNYEDKEQHQHFLKLFNSLQNKRMIFLDNIGFFILTDVEYGYDDDGTTYKDIEAQSCEVELQFKKLPYIEDNTYKFTDILETAVGTTPMWTIAYIDGTIADKYRTFSDVDTDQNVLSFLLEDMQDAYECIFLFDTVHREISVYDQDNYVRMTDIHLTRDDLVNSLDIKESSDDLYTAISVYGDDDLTIAAVNPLGTSVIYNFDYYLSWMSDGLRAKVEAWSDLVNYYSNKDGNTPSTDDYTRLGEEYSSAYAEYLEAAADIDQLNTQLSLYQRCYDNISAYGGNSLVASYNTYIAEAGGDTIDESITDIAELQSVVSGYITSTSASITAKTADRDESEKNANAIWQQMLDINARVSIKTYFTEDEYNELSSYISEGSYTDEYVTTIDDMDYTEKYDQMRLLYQRATTQLEKISQPTQEFSVDVENFLFQKDFAHFTEQLETGCIVNVELDDGDVAPLFLSNFTVNYDDMELSMTFGNRFCRFDPKAMFEDVLGSVKKSANTIEYMKQILYPIKTGELENLQSAFAQSRNITKDNALEATDQNIIIDDTGYTGKKSTDDGEFDPRQIKIVNNNIVFTKDAWETCSTAIGEITFTDTNGDTTTTYGVNAETLIGDVIIGSQLRIGYSSGSTGETKDIVEALDGTVGNVKIQYYLSTSSRTLCDGTWTDEEPTDYDDSMYLWTRNVYTYGDGSSTTDAPVCMEGSPGKDGENALALYIVSSNGNIFKNGDIQTTLSALVYSGSEEVTDEFDDNAFVWTRVSADTDADAKWNVSHYGGTKEINVTTSDVYVRATFFCDLVDVNTRASLL